jgi:F-type H+-transporting ATPase subunit gamma
MPSLRDLRRKIKSVKNMEKITKAMELVAAAKMRRAQERVVASRPYADELRAIMADLTKRTLEYQHSYLVPREVKKRCLILVTTDRGQVGALNGNSIRMAVKEMNAQSTPVSVITIGRKGRDAMSRLRKELIADASAYGDAPAVGAILPATRVALQQYEAGEVDQVDIVFARFASAGRQIATLERLLPIENPQGDEDGPKVKADFEYEPDPKVVLDELLPRYVEAIVYQHVLENSASEQAARMLAMHNASDNAGDLIESFTLTANQVRQSTVTTQLMEIVGGVAALEDSN